ncbi:putative sulfate transporter 3.3 [Zostera marina]|uniref:Putative sulfate transporter 3.3 n=1 Tax=Zostera marina TaxID=29655 RepID=A0A0K9Q0S2_ZOSMR|nr:putative sulfate transporter 3.3 [Zostera marina]
MIAGGAGGGGDIAAGGSSGGRIIEMIEIGHKVATPPKTTTVEKLKRRFKETFFPDDPFRQFKGKSSRTKWILGAQYIFPLLQWVPEYSFKLFKSDFVSGLTIASLAIPQGISYAKLAKLPPIIGLYSSFVPPLVYSVLGSSKDLAVGPVSIASLIMGSMLTEVVEPNKDPYLFLQLSFTTTLFAGIFQASFGILRLGFIIDFLSNPTLVGYMAGAAIIVSLQQLKALLGIVHFTNKMGLVAVISSVFQTTSEWSWQTILMGLSFLAVLLLARHVSIKNPRLFWLSAGAPLASVVVSTILVFTIGAQKHDISIIGKMKHGLNRPSWDMLTFDSRYLSTVIKTGFLAGITSLAEGIAVGRTFASLKDYQVDGNKEMMAIGLMNVVGSCTSCYVTTGAFSRSAVNSNAGCKTAMSNIIMSITVMVTLLFLMPLFVYTPNVVLSAIIITAVVGLVDVPSAIYIWKMDKMDFVVCMCALFGVLFISVQSGLAIAVGISVSRILLQVTRPKIEMLGRIPGTKIYRDLNHYKDAIPIGNCLILAIQTPINFINTTYLKERISRWIEEKMEDDKQFALQFIIIDLSSVSTIDTNGISFIMNLKKTMTKRNLEIVFVNPEGEVMEKLQRANSVDDFLGPNSLYLTVNEAVIALSSSTTNL